MTIPNTTKALPYSEFGDPGPGQTFANLSESRVHPAPVSLDNEQAAMFWINPATAWRMLNDFADLHSGDWIIQNAATSAVGRFVIPFAATQGTGTANLVSNLEGKPEKHYLILDGQ